MSQVWNYLYSILLSIWSYFSNGGSRKLLKYTAGAIALALVIFWSTMIGHNLLWENYKIKIFVNGIVPLSGIRISVIFFVICILELISPGFTIGKIMDLRGEDSWQKRGVAVAFILGVMWLVLKCMSTKFVGE